MAKDSEFRVVFYEGLPERGVLGELVDLLDLCDSFYFKSFRKGVDKVLLATKLERVTQTKRTNPLYYLGFDAEFRAVFTPKNKQIVSKLLTENPEPYMWRVENSLPEEVRLMIGDKTVCRWSWDAGIVEVRAGGDYLSNMPSVGSI